MSTCTLNKKTYSEGSLACINDSENVCSDGEWSVRADQCGGDCNDIEDSIKSPSQEGESCYYADKLYGHGSRICQNGIPMTCLDGKWYNNG